MRTNITIEDQLLTDPKRHALTSGRPFKRGVEDAPRVELAALERPLSIDQAIVYVEQWLEQPLARAVAPGTNRWQVMRGLSAANGTGGNLTTEAHIGALAIEHGCSVCSADHDFKRFAGIRHVNPLAG